MTKDHIDEELTAEFDIRNNVLDYWERVQKEVYGELGSAKERHKDCMLSLLSMIVGELRKLNKK